MLDQLTALTHSLGQPHLEYVIVGEGNTSCRVDDDSFWIKASGQQMQSITPQGFVAMRLEPVLALLDNPPQNAADLQAAMQAARVQPDSPQRPSVEVTFHAALLADCGARFIAHTHPTAVNQILCSSRAEQFAHSRLFPDQVVLCGPDSVFVPYVDPGLPLALAIRQQVLDYTKMNNEPPKVIYLANHGLIVLAQTPEEALSVTAMCVKAAHIFSGACAIGEPVMMSEGDIQHIYKRPDEIYRRQRFVGNGENHALSTGNTG
ncbi:MAG: class II aldolase/adducin family protein [Anaerolineae bacterium]|nr:class II aldolase/adducin family protein [Anaerolineae bacterium]